MTGAAKGERNTRHDAVDDVWHGMTTASSTRPVKRLTKGNYKNPASVARARMQGDLYNVGKIADGVEVGGAPGGKHRIRETQCYTPLVPSTAGTGSRGGPAMVGHTHAMGNTEESLRRINLGVADIGAASESAFDHTTGIGCARGVRGKYHDALQVKCNTVDLCISEVFGGLNATGVARLAAGSKAVAENSDIDGTAYDVERRWRLSFHEHWARKLASAAVFGDARVTVKHIDALVARAMRAALPPAPPAMGGPMAYPPLATAPSPGPALA